MQHENVSKNTPIDIFRETYLRYFGYLGAFPFPLSRLILFNVSKMACVTYLVADMQDKLPSESFEGSTFKRDALVNGFDVLIFHSISSLLIPSLVLRSVKSCVGKFLSGTAGLERIMPAVLSIAVIPIASRYIDNSTNYTMDKSYRRIFVKSLEAENAVIRKNEEKRREPLLGEIHNPFESISRTDKFRYGENRERSKRKNKEENKVNNINQINSKDSAQIGQGDMAEHYE